MNGLRLYRFTVVFGEVSVDFDVREWWDSRSLADDLQARDFTINTLYLYKDVKKFKIFYTKKVREQQTIFLARISSLWLTGGYSGLFFDKNAKKWIF